MKAKEPAIFFSIIAINKMLQKFKKKKPTNFGFQKELGSTVIRGIVDIFNTVW